MLAGNFRRIDTQENCKWQLGSIVSARYKAYLSPVIEQHQFSQLSSPQSGHHELILRWRKKHDGHDVQRFGASSVQTSSGISLATQRLNEFVCCSRFFDLNDKVEQELAAEEDDFLSINMSASQQENYEDQRKQFKLHTATCDRIEDGLTSKELVVLKGSSFCLMKTSSTFTCTSLHLGGKVDNFKPDIDFFHFVHVCDPIPWATLDDVMAGHAQLQAKLQEDSCIQELVCDIFEQR
ncbi:unnamed protein product [Sphagnum troendelagicum]|uniref:Uncharacterized protein n=1 Tax=Sphagnum troendelagicum TaxID=128251 RepID=A0ABP0T7U5_9BRYO